MAEIALERGEKPVKLSVAVMLETFSGGLVLVRQRGSDQWGPIAGRLKEKESPTDAFIRELKEESGMTIRDIEDLRGWETPFIEGDGHDNMGVVYRAVCRLTDNEVNNLIPQDIQEIAEVKVFSQMELYQMMFFEEDKIYKPKFNVRNLTRWLILKRTELPADNALIEASHNNL